MIRAGKKKTSKRKPPSKASIRSAVESILYSLSERPLQQLSPSAQHKQQQQVASSSADNAGSSEFVSSLHRMESLWNDKFNEMNGRFALLNTRCAQLEERNIKLEQDFIKVVDFCKKNFEKSKIKNGKSLKRIEIELKEDLKGFIKTLVPPVRVESNKSEQVDQAKNASALLSQIANTSDTDVILDHLASRLKRLESRIGQVEFADAYEITRSKKDSIKSSPVSNQPVSEIISDLTSKINQHEKLLSDKRSVEKGMTLSSSKEDESNDLKKVHSKLSKLTDGTSKACRSLSSSISDVEHSMLLLYSWADKVHLNLEAVSNKLDMPLSFSRPQFRSPKIHSTNSLLSK